MLRVQLDDAASFGDLLTRNRTRVVQYLGRMVKNRAIAEELAQDVFIRVYRSRHAWVPAAKFSTWLFRITTNVALNHFRNERYHNADFSLDQRPDHTESADLRGELRDHSPLIDEQLVFESLTVKVREAIQGLPPKQRAAVVMHKYDELDYAQIAGALGCSPAAVKALMFRAYETLRVRLQ
ncbi:MAG: RNA polymerase sigma factor [Acidobacteriota bacterium]